MMRKNSQNRARTVAVAGTALHLRLRLVAVARKQIGWIHCCGLIDNEPIHVYCAQVEAHPPWSHSLRRHRTENPLYTHPTHRIQTWDYIQFNVCAVYDVFHAWLLYIIIQHWILWYSAKAICWAWGRAMHCISWHSEHVLFPYHE